MRPGFTKKTWRNGRAAPQLRRAPALAGACARRLHFKGSEAKHGFWNKGISACSVCDGPSFRFKDQPLAVVGGGDSAMEEVSLA